MSMDRDPGGRKGRVFVSYAREDGSAAAQHLREALTARDYEVFLDTGEIATFEDWWRRIEALILRSDTVLFLITPGWVRSGPCHDELSEARLHGKRCLPVLVSPTPAGQVPEDLRRLNFANMPAPHDAAALDELDRALSLDLDWLREHSRLGEAATEWDRRGRPYWLLLRGKRLKEAENWLARQPPEAQAPTAAQRLYVAVGRRVATTVLMVVVAATLLAAAVSTGLGIRAELNGREAERQRTIAVENAEEARRQRDAAQRNYVLARETVNDVLFQFAEGFRHASGVRGDVVSRVLARARTSLDKLSRGAPDDLDLSRMRTVHLISYGGVLYAAGDTGAALASYREAHAAALAMARDIRGNPDIAPVNVIEAMGLAGNALDRIGDILLETGSPSDALKIFEQALAILEELGQREPANPDWKTGLSVTLGKVGDARLEAGDARGALTAYETSLDVAVGLAAADPGTGRLQNDVAAGLDRIGGLRRDMGDPAGALVAFERSLAIARDLARSTPGNTQVRRHLSISLNNFGLARKTAGDLAGAQESIEEALAIRRGLVDEDPENIVWARDFAISLSLVADLRLAAGKHAPALAAYTQSLAQFRKLALRDAGNPERDRDLFRIQNKIATFHLSKAPGADRAKAASALCDMQALTASLRARDAFPGHQRWSEDVSDKLRQLRADCGVLTARR